MKKIILVGNANTGKTTIFNELARTNLKVGNWLGVTVKAFEKVIEINGEPFILVDLPGIYNLTGTTQDEKQAILYLKENKNNIIINVVDCFNLQRNLLLTLELKDAGFKPLVLFNFYDKFVKNNSLDLVEISKRLKLDCYIFNKKKIPELKIKAAKGDTSSNIDFGKVKQVEGLQKEKYIKYYQDKYTEVDKVLNKAYFREKNKIYGYSKIDKFLLNKWIAIPTFAIIMLAVFYITFGNIGDFLSNIIASGTRFLFDLILDLFKKWNFSSSVIIFFSKAIFTPIVTVFKFCVQVIIMVFMLNVLEHSGYISRIAFVLDDFLSKIGLSGKGIFTLLLGLGCATTAVQTVRVIENKNVKLKTAILTSIMPCTAKLPICALIISSFFKGQTFLIMFFIYVFCILTLILLALIFNTKKYKTGESNLLLEFPSYKKIKLKVAFKNSVDTLFGFVSRIFGLVVSVNVILFLLQNIYLDINFLNIGRTSLLYLLSSFVSFLFIPLGLASPLIVSSLCVGILAKELVVSSLILSFGQAISTAFTPFSAISFLLFVMFYCPCISTMAAIKSEFSPKVMWLAFASQFAIAYIISFLVYNIFRLFEFINGGLVFSFLITMSLLIIAILITAKLAFKQKKCCKNCKGCCIDC